MFAGSAGSVRQTAGGKGGRRFSSPPPRTRSDAGGSPSKQTKWAPQLDGSSLVPSVPTGPLNASSTRQLRHQDEAAESRQSDPGRGRQDILSIPDSEVTQFLQDIRDDISDVHTTAAVARAASLAATKPGEAQNVTDGGSPVPDVHVQSSSLVQEQQIALESLRAEVTKMQNAMQAHEQSVADLAGVTTDHPNPAPQHQPKQWQADHSHRSSGHHVDSGASETRLSGLRRVDQQHVHDGWKEGYDTARDKTYWYNLRTKETRWQHDAPQISAHQRERNRTPERSKRAGKKQTHDRSEVGATFVAQEFGADSDTAFQP